jgi:uroporphyrinogen decarboxylase
MTSRELVVRTLNQEPVPRVPRDLWMPSGEDHPQAEELAEINTRYPSDIVAAEPAPHTAKRQHGKHVKGSEQRDAWGCEYFAGGQIAAADPKQAPLADLSKIASYQPPAALLDHARFAKADKLCPTTSRFVLAWSDVRPLDRLRMLCGSDAAILGLARGNRDIRGLLAMLHDFACKELERWAETEVDGVAFRDDWGVADGLLISADMWQELFRPLYRQYCKILHAKDKFVFFRSGGNISDIFSEATKLGIDAIHADLHLMNPLRLIKRYRGRVTFWGGMDPRQLLEPGTAEEFRNSVLALRRELDFGDGGVIAQCQWDPGVRLQTVAALFEQWLVPLPVHGS